MRHPDGNDSWAMVELYRWQYGRLPVGIDEKLSIPIALNKMADAIEKKDMNNFPTPLAVMSILRFVAKKLK